KNPFVQIGASKKIIGFSTDGFQFFGTDYRVSNEIKKLYSPSLENRNYQYEFAYIALQSEKFILDSGLTEEISFYTLFKENIPEENVTEIFPVANILEKIQNISHTDEKSGKYKPNLFGEVDFFDSRDAENSDVSNFYPDRKHSEYVDGKLISFFTPEGFYISMKDKERRVERNTGHIMISGNFLEDRDNIISSTSFGMGIFNSQITVGNTSFNKLIGINRNPLNLQKFSGQRIFIKRDNVYTQLGTPTFYEIGYNSCRWIYLSGDEKIVVRTFTSGESPVLALEITSSKSHDFIISNHLVFGANEFDSVIETTVSERRIDIRGKNKLIESAYENLKFAYVFNQDFQILDTAGQNLIIKLTGNNLKINILGSVEKDEIKAEEFINYSEEKRKFREKLSAVIGGFKITSLSHGMDKISDMGLWYAHNAMIHFASPHGLEQYSGAAWGTRDLSQGPFELFMSTQNYKEAAKILKELYKHQYIETGVWPQWFMFDNYSKIQQEECHGDIVVWPIKITADYIKASGDYKILDTPVAFTSIEKGFNFTEKKDSILNHLKKQIHYIKNNLIPGTSLLSYGYGDWDDTLQPKNSQLRKNMVSCWTIELLIQSLKVLGEELEKYKIHDAFAEEVIELEELMREDFKKYAIQKDVVSGFLLYEDGIFKPMLHPEDKITNIKYRLLPMTRGIISEIFDAAEAERHYSIIQKNLLFPDG
ncbi:MAG: GH36-type glycosyl hydrolase domain-containing protein, partial [Fusobacteriaceae bacterium]